MSLGELNLNYLKEHFPDLEVPGRNRNGTLTFRLRLPEFPLGRSFEWVELQLPRGFPDRAHAKISFSPDAVLRVPHVDASGTLCAEGDPGPGLGYSPEDRILLTLQDYQQQFLEPWLTGILEDDFAKESLNYWAILVQRSSAEGNPIRAIWTVDRCPGEATVRRGLLVTPKRIVIAADERLPITGRLIQSLGERAQQRKNVLVADIPITYPLTPQTWPKTMSDLELILCSQLTGDERRSFLTGSGRRHRPLHRVVLLRNSEVAYAYLLPGGPPTVIDRGKSQKTFPSLNKPRPLDVARFDPSWTVGRDQHPAVEIRQGKHVLVLGAGALGSPVVDHLAKAGVSSISVVDDDYLWSANIGRHLLGADAIGKRKAEATARRINLGYPATVATPFTMTAQKWLERNTLLGVDLVIDLTGEPDVRRQIDQARLEHACPLLIGWMEPFVASAHACVLPANIPWMQGKMDSLTDLEAVTWPVDVLRREPGCSSLFQSYTAAAAGHAVALVAEQAIELLDGEGDSNAARVVSWVRGQNFLDRHWPGLELKDWARSAASHDGLILIRPFP